jgi:hypothetical protein
MFGNLLTWVQNLFSDKPSSAPAPASNSGGQSHQASVDAGAVPAANDKNGPAPAAAISVPNTANVNKFATQKVDPNNPASQLIQGVLASVSRVIGTVVPESGQS